MNTKNDNFSAYVGLDWADKKHDICVQVKDEESRAFSVISHSPESINDWVEALHKKVCDESKYLKALKERGTPLLAVEKAC